MPTKATSISKYHSVKCLHCALKELKYYFLHLNCKRLRMEIINFHDNVINFISLSLAMDEKEWDIDLWLWI